MTRLRTVTISVGDSTFSATFWTDQRWVVVSHPELGTREDDPKGMRDELFARILLRELVQANAHRIRPA